MNSVDRMPERLYGCAEDQMEMILWLRTDCQLGEGAIETLIERGCRNKRDVALLIMYEVGGLEFLTDIELGRIVMALVEWRDDIVEQLMDAE
jgi:hypothetical protein